MNLYQLKAIINELQQEQEPANRALLAFYCDLYQSELLIIANKVQNELDKQPLTKYWLQYLTK